MDPSAVKCEILPKEVRYLYPFGNGRAVVCVYLASTTPRVVSYHEVQEGRELRREPLSQTIEDLVWFIEDAKGKYFRGSVPSN